jgi:hypothetical protein
MAKHVYQTRTDATGHPVQFEAEFTYTFADGTVEEFKAIIRQDFGEQASTFTNRGVHEATDHYNVEIQKFIETKTNGKHNYDNNYINMHILLDQQHQPFRAFCTGKSKFRFDSRLTPNQQNYQHDPQS